MIFSSATPAPQPTGFHLEVEKDEHDVWTMVGHNHPFVPILVPILFHLNGMFSNILALCLSRRHRAILSSLTDRLDSAQKNDFGRKDCSSGSGL